MIGLNENTVTDQLLDWVRYRCFGKYRGIVMDNKDTTNRGRLKVKVPSVLPDVEVWAMPCLPYTGKDVGTYIIPEPDAGVWVEFEAGDRSFPIWSGGYWVDDELPKLNNGNRAKPGIRMIRSEKGLQIALQDDDETITISDTNGKNKITIIVQEGKIRMEADMKIVIESPQIELVENSTHPVVFGDDLLQYLNNIVSIFNAHIHPGVLGNAPVTISPPLITLPPATSVLLSTKVKTG